MRTRIHGLRLFRSFPDPCRGFRVFPFIARKDRVCGGERAGDDDFRLPGEPSAKPGIKDGLDHKVDFAHPDSRDSYLGMHRLPDFSRRFGELAEKYGLKIIGVDRTAATGKSQGKKSDFSGNAGRKFRLPRRPEFPPFAFRVLKGNRCVFFWVHKILFQG